MKKHILIFCLFLFNLVCLSQSKQDYRRYGKLTTDEINNINTDRIDVVYAAFDTTLGYEVINLSDGNGWVRRIPDSGSGSLNSLPQLNTQLGTNIADGPHTPAPDLSNYGRLDLTTIQTWAGFHRFEGQNAAILIGQEDYRNGEPFNINETWPSSVPYSNYVFDNGNFGIRRFSEDGTKEERFVLTGTSDYTGYILDIDNESRSPKSVAKFFSDPTNDRVAEFYGRIGGQDAVNADEFVTLSQAQGLGGGGSLTTDQQNRILNANKSRVPVELSADANLSTLAVEVTSGTDIGRALVHKESDGETTITIDDTGSIGDVWPFRTDGGTINLLEGSGVTINSTLTSDPDGVSITGVEQYIYLRKDAANTYYAVSVDVTEFVPVQNIYVEASAVNPINQSPVLGTWKRADGDQDNMSVVSDVPSGSAMANSIRLNGNFAASFVRMELSFVDMGVSLTVGQSYTIAFDYKRVSGDTTGNGFTVRIAGAGNTDVEVTEAATGVWESATVNFTADTAQPTIWFVNSFGTGGIDQDLTFTNFTVQ